MSYTVTTHNGAFVIRMEASRLDYKNSPALKIELMRLLERRPSIVIVDFAMVRFVDPNGLAALLSGVRVAARSGGRIRVAGLSPDIHAIFAQAQLDRIFDIFPTPKEALASG